MKGTQFVRRHRIASSLVILLLALLAVVGGYVWWLNSSLGNVDRIDVTLNEKSRPQASDGTSMNVLLLGADAGTERSPGGDGILADAASGDWPVGRYRSDAMMLMHIPADRGNVTVVSFPRDSLVEIYDDQGQPAGRNKINAALSLHGPSGAIATVENLTNLRIDHLTMLDWDGFRGITDALGGVTMTTDEGRRTFNGQEALDYVRDRFTVRGGDFGRIQRQQNFLRAVVQQTLSRGTLSDPLKLQSAVEAVTKSIAVDDQWSNGDLRSLAVSMRGLRADDLTFVTTPTTGTADEPTLGSVVLLDRASGKQLYQAIREERLSDFLASRPELKLPPGGQVD